MRFAQHEVLKKIGVTLAAIAAAIKNRAKRQLIQDDFHAYS